MATYPKNNRLYEHLPTIDLEAIKQWEQEEKWRRVEERLSYTERAFARIDFAGYATLSIILRPLRNRYNKGERSQALYDEIMEVTL